MVDTANVGRLAQSILRSLQADEPLGSTLRLVRQFIMDLNASDAPSRMVADEPPRPATSAGMPFLPELSRISQSTTGSIPPCGCSIRRGFSQRGGSSRVSTRCARWPSPPRRQHCPTVGSSCRGRASSMSDRTLGRGQIERLLNELSKRAAQRWSSPIT